jgi:hypothetical protein
MRKFPYILFAAAVVLFFGPFPLYVYVVKPYAAATKDPDAIEAVAWFGGTFIMLLGAGLAPISLGCWLYGRRHSN